jgi:hypothetical protein
MWDVERLKVKLLAPQGGKYFSVHRETKAAVSAVG